MAQKQEEKNRNPDSPLDRLVICLRFTWCWHGFWNSWANKAYVLILIVWTLLVSIVAVLMQAVDLIFHPLWRLIIEPSWIALFKKDVDLSRIEKILDR